MRTETRTQRGRTMLKKYAMIALPIVLVVIGYNLVKAYGPASVTRFLP